MPNFQIPFDKIKEVYEDIHDQLLTSDCASYVCTLYYPPIQEPCANCEYAGFGSTHNIYRHGGPAPFNFGNCPMCAGTNIKETEYTEDIRLRLYPGGNANFSKRAWTKLSVPFQNGEGELLAIGYLSDLDKIKSANYAIMYTEVISNSTYKFELAAEPYPHGIGRDRYLVSYWERK